MKIFSSRDPRSASRIIWKIFLTIYWAVLTVFLLYNFSPLKINPVSFSFCLAIFHFHGIYDTLSRTCINKICIDEAAQQVSLYCYKPFRGNKEYHGSFKEIKLEIIVYKRPKAAGNPVIYFFKKKRGDFYLSADKDGFSNKTMREIAALLESLTVPVNNKKTIVPVHNPVEVS